MQCEKMPGSEDHRLSAVSHIHEHWLGSSEEKIKADVRSGFALQTVAPGTLCCGLFLVPSAVQTEEESQSSYPPPWSL